MTLKLMLPNEDMKDAFTAYAKEWEDSGEHIIPYTTRLRGRTYEQWLQDTEAITQESTCPEGLVPATTYCCTNQTGKIVGTIDIRHRLNDYLMNFGGHIGYGIRPSMRGQGYGTKMLALGLEICKARKIAKVLICCRTKNAHSRQVIINNGGVLENTVNEDGDMVERYWIEVLG